LEGLKKIKQERGKTEKVVGATESSQPKGTPVQASSPATEKRKRKDKDKTKKQSFLHHSPKRSRPNTFEASGANAGQLFAPDLTFFKGVSVSLSPAERDALNAVSTEDLLATCLEMQSRALTITKVLRSEFSKGDVAELAKIKKELFTSTSCLKAALKANAAQGEARRKSEQEKEALKAQCNELKKEKKRLSRKVRDLESTLSEVTLTHDDVVSKKVQMEMEFNEMKDFVFTVRRAVLLYGVPERNEKDPNSWFLLKRSPPPLKKSS